MTEKIQLRKLSDNRTLSIVINYCESQVSNMKIISITNQFTPCDYTRDKVFCTIKLTKYFEFSGY
jgi:hypothetical protein